MYKQRNKINKYLESPTEIAATNEILQNAELEKQVAHIQKLGQCVDENSSSTESSVVALYLTETVCLNENN